MLVAFFIVIIMFCFFCENATVSIRLFSPGGWTPTQPCKAEELLEARGAARDNEGALQWCLQRWGWDVLHGRLLSFTWSLMEPRHTVIERGSLKGLYLYSGRDTGQKKKTGEWDRKKWKDTRTHTHPPPLVFLHTLKYAVQAIISCLIGRLIQNHKLALGYLQIIQRISD